MSVPGRDFLRSRGELGIGGDDAQLLLAGEDLFAQLVPALVELALVFVRPFLGHGVRCVRAAGRQVDEERLVRHQRLLLLHPFDRVGGDVIVEVVALLRRLRRLDRGGALVEVRPVVVRLRADETIEVLEAAAARGPRRQRVPSGSSARPAPRGTCRYGRSSSRSASGSPPTARPFLAGSSCTPARTVAASVIAPIPTA